MVVGLIIVVSIANITCFIVGAKIGQMTKQGEEIKVSNPVKAVEEAIEEHRESREQREEQERIQTMLENIDNYDGTGLGQKDV